MLKLNGLSTFEGMDKTLKLRANRRYFQEEKSCDLQTSSETWKGNIGDLEVESVVLEFPKKFWNTKSEFKSLTFLWEC